MNGELVPLRLCEKGVNDILSCVWQLDHSNSRAVDALDVNVRVLNNTCKSVVFYCYDEGDLRQWAAAMKKRCSANSYCSLKANKGGCVLVLTDNKKPSNSTSAKLSYGQKYIFHGGLEFQLSGTHRNP